MILACTDNIDFGPEYKQTNSNITKGQQGILVIHAVLFAKNEKITLFVRH